jgi:hypothetical protein
LRGSRRRDRVEENVLVRRLSMLAVGVTLSLALAGCGGGSGKPPATTTTTAPPTTTTTTPPPVLTIDPATAPISAVITLTVTGAKPGESITFTLTSPKGKVFNGTPHVVDPTGAASATYNSTGDEVGAHTVQAVGTGGTSLTGTFTLTKS